MSSLSPHEQRARAIELLVFLVLIVPPMMLSWFAAGTASEAAFSLVAAAMIIGDVGLIALVAYLNWRSGEPAARIGWTRHHLVRDLILGVVLFAPFVVVTGGLEWLLHAAGLSHGGPSSLFPPITGTAEVVLAGALLVTVAVAEETVFRGYLLLRLEEWSGSKTVAVLASSVIFTLGHHYEGPAGMIIVGVMGVILALVYLWRRSLVAPVVLHLLQNVLAFLLPA